MEWTRGNRLAPWVSREPSRSESGGRYLRPGLACDPAMSIRSAGLFGSPIRNAEACTDPECARSLLMPQSPFPPTPDAFCRSGRGEWLHGHWHPSLALPWPSPLRSDHPSNASHLPAPPSPAASTCVRERPQADCALQRRGPALPSLPDAALRFPGAPRFAYVAPNTADSAFLLGPHTGPESGPKTGF